MNAPNIPDSPDVPLAVRSSDLLGWNEKAKLIALDFRFYQHAQDWEPKVGDYYCITRAGLTLCQIAKIENGKIAHRTICDDYGNDATSWPVYEWTADEFLRGGFMKNRCYVPAWAFQPIPHQETPDEACAKCKHNALMPDKFPCAKCSHMDFEDIENQKSYFQPNDKLTP